MKQVYLLTGNKDKIKYANSIFNPAGIEVLPLELGIEEIQAGSSSEIAKHMAIEAYERTKKPVIREDHSFYIDELGFPGPFMSYVDKKITPDQLLKIVSTLNSKTAHFELAAAYIDSKGQLYEFSYSVPVIFADRVSGDESYNWERLICLPNESRTFAESDSADRSELWTRNFKNIAKLISDS